MQTNKASPYKVPLIVLSVLLALTIAALIVIWTVLGPSDASAEKTETTNFLMGTYVTQTVYGGDTVARTSAVTAANQAVSQLNDRISWRTDGSDIQRLNSSAGGDPVSIDPETATVLQRALEVAERSKGAYDPTILPLSLLWNFDSEETTAAPEDADIQRYLPYVDYKQLELDTDTYTAALGGKHAAIDLGAIGKGAGADVAVAAYADSQITGGLIAVGGSIGVYGTKPDGTPWKIGVRDPHSGDDKEASMGVLSIDSGFVSTSGTYELMFEENGVVYHHILDPDTGYPADTDLLSVTVWCDNGALSDALSTTCLVLGVEDSLDLLASYDADAVFITNENQVIVTDDLKDRFELTSSDYTLRS